MVIPPIILKILLLKLIKIPLLFGKQSANFHYPDGYYSHQALLIPQDPLYI